MTLPTFTTLAESPLSTYRVSRSRAFSVLVIRVWISEGTTGGASPPAARATGLGFAAIADGTAARPAATASGRSALRVSIEKLLLRGEPVAATPRRRDAATPRRPPASGTGVRMSDDRATARPAEGDDLIVGLATRDATARPHRASAPRDHRLVRPLCRPG